MKIKKDRNKSSDTPVKKSEPDFHPDLITEIAVFLYWEHLFLMSGVKDQRAGLPYSKEEISASMAAKRSEAYHPGIKGVLKFLKEKGMLTI